MLQPECNTILRRIDHLIYSYEYDTVLYSYSTLRARLEKSNVIASEHYGTSTVLYEYEYQRDYTTLSVLRRYDTSIILVRV